MGVSFFEGYPRCCEGNHGAALLCRLPFLLYHRSHFDSPLGQAVDPGVSGLEVYAINQHLGVNTVCPNGPAMVDIRIRWTCMSTNHSTTGGSLLFVAN